MAKPSNPENRYSFTCKVTGETVKTNPKQFSALATRYNITNEELDVSYVSRAGRRVITDEKLSPESAVEKYGIHLNVAQNLKCTVKEKVRKNSSAPVIEQTDVQEAETVEAVQNTVIEVSEITENSFTESVSSEVSEETAVTA